MKIGIIGSGTAGAVSAMFLHDQGHQVKVFEKVPVPGPVGAGIMLQPTGIKVLEKLGLAEKVISHGHIIKEMLGTSKEGKKVLDLSFEDVNSDYFGLGVHRGNLFTFIMEKFNEKNIPLLTNCEVTAINKKKAGYILTDQNKSEHGPYDLVVVSAGAGSKLRDGFEEVRRSKKQSWAAVWAKIPVDEPDLRHKIRQIYDGPQKMLGLMPIGSDPGMKTKNLVNLFWSIKLDNVEDWKKSGVDAWKEDVLALAPQYAHLIDKINTYDQMIVAPYFDAFVSPMYHEGIFFIGDAAHAMSPQLSSGTNLALMDADTLAESIKQCNSLSEAAAVFNKKRRSQLRYYHQLSRMVTPVFQSELPIKTIRDNLFGKLCKFSPVKRLMVHTVMGMKSGYFSRLPESRAYKLS